jgi:hypothetical protein
MLVALRENGKTKQGSKKERSDGEDIRIREVQDQRIPCLLCIIDLNKPCLDIGSYSIQFRI